MQGQEKLDLLKATILEQFDKYMDRITEDPIGYLTDALLPIWDDIVNGENGELALGRHTIANGLGVILNVPTRVLGIFEATKEQVPENIDVDLETFRRLVNENLWVAMSKLPSLAQNNPARLEMDGAHFYIQHEIDQMCSSYPGFEMIRPQA